MNMKNAIKTARYLTIGTAGAWTLSALVLPGVAMAADSQWSPESMMRNAGGTAGLDVNNNKITTENVTAWVNSVVSWAVGIFVAFFVLRIALTAFDRMVVANMNTTFAVPGAYPNPGDERYDKNDIQNEGATVGWTWKRIWINFAKNIAIVVGAWIIVQLIMNLVLFAMNNTGLKQ